MTPAYGRMMLQFQPASYLCNPHLQTLLGSAKLRHYWVTQRSHNLLEHSETTLLRTTDGVRLQTALSKNPRSNHKLAILLHGWEGSANSAYILGCGQSLFNLGYTIARLNLRDHGDTHHLNRLPFNSVQVNEVYEAIINLAQRYPNEGILLLGFSLGGNFCLRLSAQRNIQELGLEKTIAICPAIDPVHTSNTLEHGHWIYHHYFLKKWRASLEKKYRYYPEIMHSPDDIKKGGLQAMNAKFVPLYTGYERPEDYLSAYRITQATLESIPHSCDIIYSDDDPIINANDYDHLEETDNVRIHAQVYGGHCAFLQDWHLTSWIDAILPELVRA